MFSLVQFHGGNMYDKNPAKKSLFRSKSGATIALFLLNTMLLAGCPLKRETTEKVSIDEVFWEAFRDPVGFDAYLDAQALDARTSSCFRQYRDEAFANEQDKLLECSVIIAYTPPWDDCHNEAEVFHNNGVAMNDIAGAIDGPGNFAETSTYSYLVINKSFLTDADWNAYVDVLQAAAPPYVCKYEKEEWLWE